MLLIDNEKVSRDELAKRFKFDLSKIEKQPSFEVDKSKISKDKANGNVIKVNAGTSIRSHFYVNDPITKVNVQVKYAKGQQTKQVGKEMVTEYSPRYVKFFKETGDGGHNSSTKFSFQDDLDLAVYFYLNPQNRFSPLRAKNNKKEIGYEFIDTKARALDKMSGLNKTADAMAHAKAMADDAVVIISKGLGFQKVDSKDTDTLRADLLEFALKKPTEYMDAVNTGIVRTEGLIVNLIDRGVLVLDKINGVRQWKWASGEREGESIGSQITNPTQDAKSVIKNYILNNLHIYKTVLETTTDNLKSKEKAKEFFKAQEVESNVIGEDLPEHLREVNQTKPTILLPQDFQACKDFVEARGYKKLTNKIKILNDGIQDGSVTSDNIERFLEQIYAED